MSDPYAAFGAPVDPYAQYGAPAAAQPQAPNTFMDMLKSFGAGAVQGVTGLTDLTDHLTGASFARDQANAQLAKLQKPQIPKTSELLDQKIGSLFGGLHTPETIAGQYAHTVGEFAPAAFAGPEGMIPKAMSVLVPAVSSETAGQLTKGTPAEPYARFAGGLLSGGAMGIKANPSAVLGEVSPETASLFSQAQKLGINVRPGQAAGRPFTKVADSVLERMPGTGYGTPKVPTNAQQAGQFTRAVSKTFGEDSHLLDQATMSGAKARIGNVYDTVLPRNQITLDEHLVDKLNEISKNAGDNLLPGGQRDSVNFVLHKIKEKMAEGLDPNTPLLGTGNPYRLTGKQYQAMRATGGAVDNIANSADPTVAHYGQQIKTALDKAFERQAIPADAAALKLARHQYRNFKTVEPLAAKSSTGEISPALLANLVQKNFPELATRGAGDLGTLGKIGQRFLKDPPNSGTSERSLVLKLLSNPLNASAEMLAYPVTSPTGRLMRRIINSQPVKPNGANHKLLKFSPYRGLFGGAMGLNSSQQNP